MENYEREYNKWLDRGLTKPVSTNETKFDMFGKMLKFGTGGIRAVMGPGTNRLNIYTIRQIAKGFADYTNSSTKKTNLIIVAYDNRKNSKLFAIESAKVLASENIRVKLFSHLVPTPELSFAIRHTKADGGIVITASHNPKEYNGFKTYDHNGCQHTPDTTKLIAKYINKYDDILSFEYEENLNNISYVTKETEEEYYYRLATIEQRPNQKKNIKIVYTPLHGTGNIPVTKMLERLNYSVIKVTEQSFPSENFENAICINPEEKKAFGLAEKLAYKKNADLIIATDPDCDRLGVGCLHDRKYQYLTGNQLGAIFIEYLISSKIKKKEIQKNSVVYDTVVTGSLGSKIAKSYGVETISTLTGFKYIGEQIAKNKNKEFLFGYEESYGYLIKDFCRDKDGIQASILGAEVCQYYKNKGMTLIDALNSIYKKYGHLEDSLESKSFNGPDGKEKIDKIVNEYRNMSKSYIEGRKIVAVEDYSISTRFQDEKEFPISLPKTNMIKLILDDDSWVAIRPSGNEPKLKIYKNLWKIN